MIGALENKFENLSFLLGNMAHETMGVSGDPLYGLPQEPSFPLPAQEESEVRNQSNKTTSRIQQAISQDTTLDATLSQFLARESADEYAEYLPLGLPPCYSPQEESVLQHLDLRNPAPSQQAQHDREQLASGDEGREGFLHNQHVEHLPQTKAGPRNRQRGQARQRYKMTPVVGGSRDDNLTSRNNVEGAPSQLRARNRVTELPPDVSGSEVETPGATTDYPGTFKADEGRIDVCHHGLEILYDTPHSQIDIIAVHSIGANPKFAWSRPVRIDGKETGAVTNWLKDDDMLPSEIPNSRILAFNYDSTRHHDRKNTMSWYYSFAENLLRAIDSSRQTRIEQQRPLIFVCHGFGGIVVEQALVIAGASESDYGLVSRCTVGVNFLGTPHMGSNAETMATVINRLSELATEPSLKAQNAPEASDSSAVLMDIVHSFMMFANRSSVDLTCFYETQKTNYCRRFGVRWNELAVTEQSACLPGYPKIPLLTNHLGLNKYTGKTDPTYLTVAPVIKKMARDALDRVKMRFEPRHYVQDNSLVPDVNLECQKALFVSWPQSELASLRRRLGERTQGTCEWLLVREEYLEWITQHRPRVLRLVGYAGSGKSMIFSYLIEGLTERLQVTPDMSLAFHICDNRNQSSNNACAVVRSILFQLFQQRPKHFHYLQKAYDIQGNNIFQDYDKLSSILFEVLHHYGDGYLESEVFILIDGLDECDSQSCQLLNESLKDISTSSFGVRIFFTTRPSDDISLSQHERLDNIITLACHMGMEDISRDMVKLLDDNVPQLCKRQGWSEKEVVFIKSNLLMKANGSFLWVSFVLQDIEKVHRKAQLPAVMEALPKDLSDVYRRITSTFHKYKAKSVMVLKIIAAADRPLKAEELALAYVLAHDSPDRWEEESIPRAKELRKHDDLWWECGGMLNIDEPTNTINLVHQSAKDYILKEYLEAEGHSASSIDLNNMFMEITFRLLSLCRSRSSTATPEVDGDFWYNDSDQLGLVKLSRDTPGAGYLLHRWKTYALAAERQPPYGHIRPAKYIQSMPVFLDSWLQRSYCTGNQLFAEWLCGATTTRISSLAPIIQCKQNSFSVAGQQSIVNEFFINRGARVMVVEGVEDYNCALETEASIRTFDDGFDVDNNEDHAINTSYDDIYDVEVIPRAEDRMNNAIACNDNSQFSRANTFEIGMSDDSLLDSHNTPDSMIGVIFPTSTWLFNYAYQALFIGRRPQP